MTGQSHKGTTTNNKSKQTLLLFIAIRGLDLLKAPFFANFKSNWRETKADLVSQGRVNEGVYDEQERGKMQQQILRES